MSIADAYVDLHVNGDSIAGEVKRSVKATNVDNETDTLGDRVGSRLGSRIFTSLRKEFRGTPQALGDLFSDMGDIVGKIPTKFALIGSAVVAVIPLVTSLSSALAGAGAALAGALAQSTAAAIPLAAGLGALIQGGLVAKMAFSGLGKAIGGNEKALKALSPAARAFVKEIIPLKKSLDGVKASVQSKVFDGLAGPMKDIGSRLIPVVKTGLGGTATQVNILLKSLAKFATSNTFLEQFGAIMKANTAIFSVLRQAAVPILDAIITLFRGIQGPAVGMAGTVVTIAKAFQSWAIATTTSGRLNSAIQTGLGIFKNLWTIVKNLGGVLVDVFGSAAPAGQGLIKTFADLTGKLKAFTGLTSSKEGIAKWAQDGISALKTVGGLISKVFSGLSGATGGGLLGKLFDPKTLEVYMSVLGQIFDAVMPIIKILKDAFQPVVIAIGNAFKDLAPKIMPLFTALGPLLKGVMAVIANIVSQAFDFIGVIAQLITPIVGFISNLIGPVIERFAPIIATIILAFTNWGGALVRLVPIVGKFVAPIVEFASFLFSKLGPVIEWLGMLVGKVFGFIGPFIAGHMNLVKTIFEAVWGVVKTVVGGAVTFVWNIITKYVSLWIGVFSKVAEIGGIVGRAFAGVFNAVKTKAGEILTWVTGWIAKLVKPFTDLIGQMTTLGGNIIRGLWDGLKGLANWIKDKIMQLIVSIVPEPIRKILGIQSPSKVAADIMKDFGKGMVVGTVASAPMVSKASADLGMSAAGSMAGALPQNFGGSTTSTTYGNINVTIAVDDLDKMTKIGDFLAMLDSSRVRQRQVERSGQVAV